MSNHAQIIIVEQVPVVCVIELNNTTEGILKLCCFKIYITSKDYSLQCNSIMFTIPVIILSAIGISIFLANDYMASRVSKSNRVK